MAEPCSMPQRRGRAISFAGQLRDAPETDEVEAAESRPLGPNRRLSHTGSIQVRVAVAPMASRKTRASRWPRH